MRAELLIALLLAAPSVGAEEYRATLTWTDQSITEEGFRVERKTGAAGAYTTVGTVGPDVVTFEDPGPLAQATEYCWRVVAFSVAGEGVSGDACVTMPTPPESPTDVGVTVTVAALLILAPGMCTGDPPVQCVDPGPPAPPESSVPPPTLPPPPEGT